MSSNRPTGCKLSWAAGKKTVLCSGTCAMDFVSVVRRFPGAKPQPFRRCTQVHWQRSGNASNNCTVLRKLGVKCEFFGMLSRLAMFRMLTDDMRAQGISTEHCPSCEQEPPFSSVVYAKATRTRNIFNCNRGTFPYVSIEDFRKLDLRHYGWIHLRSMFFETTLAMMQDLEAFNAGRQSSQDKVIVSMEFSKSLNEMWPLVHYCDYVIFSNKLARAQGWDTPAIAFRHIDDRLRTRCMDLKRPIVVLQWGDQGALFSEGPLKSTLSPAFKPRKIVDSLGAGDTFTAAFIYAIYVRERSVAEAVEFANRMASYKCTKRGFDHVADILRAPVL